MLRAINTAEHHTDPAARQRATAKIERWAQVFKGMLDGSIAIGSRIPLRDVPPWVTFQVEHGGFATGNLLSGGPLEPHELERLKSLDRNERSSERAVLNIYYLSEAGQQELLEMLNSGCYRINVPEDGALQVIAWMLRVSAEAG